jgi:hypothetical protein
LIKYLPLSFSLYSSIDRNIPYPLSRVALPLPKPLLDIALMFRDSTHREITAFGSAVSLAIRGPMTTRER